MLNGNYCRWEWTTLNDVSGYKVTSKMAGYTDRSIFMPASGFVVGNTNSYSYSNGSYWSSQTGDNVYFALTFNFNRTERGIRGDGYSNVFGWNNIGNVRWPGRSVRAVAFEKAPRP